MAIALEELTPEAESAVGAARAGRGARLSPAVSKELKAKAKTKVRQVAESAASSAPAPRRARSSGGGGSVSRAIGNAGTQGARAISGGKTGTLPRVIFAIGAGLVALEIASYVSGRYFTWSIGSGADKAKAAAKSVGMAPPAGGPGPKGIKKPTYQTVGTSHL